MLLFMAARAQLVDEKIRPAIAHGKIVLCDRFSFSTAVYQGYAGGLDVESIWNANQIATGGLVPDLTLLFDLPADEAFSRIAKGRAGGFDKMESRGEEFLKEFETVFFRRRGAGLKG
ncbi:MAG: dTMP kinase [Pirellulaceae bacterium]